MLSVKTNLLAENANRNLKVNTKKNAKTTEKLSSGYRINRAADDAAGLAISEKMRRQIRGLGQASENILDGISLCQVADGALNETVDILQRMRELAVQSANGTNSDSDRQLIEVEITQLKSEVDRIAKTTTFNEAIYPLNAPIPLYETTRTFITTDACTYAGNKYNIGDTITVTGLTNGNSDRIEVNNGDVSSSDGVYAEWRYFEWSYVDYGGMAFKPLKISDLKTDEDGYLYYENCLYSYLRIYAYYVINPDAWSGNPSFNNNSVYFNFKGDYGEGCGYARYMTVDDLQGSPTPIAIQAGISSTAGDKIPIYTVNATCAGLGITDVSVATQESSGGL